MPKPATQYLSTARPSGNSRGQKETRKNIPDSEPLVVFQLDLSQAKKPGLRVIMDSVLDVNARWLQIEARSTQSILETLLPGVLEHAREGMSTKALEEALRRYFYFQGHEAGFDPFWICNRQAFPLFVYDGEELDSPYHQNHSNEFGEQRVTLGPDGPEY